MKLLDSVVEARSEAASQRRMDADAAVARDAARAQQELALEQAKAAAAREARLADVQAKNERAALDAQRKSAAAARRRQAWVARRQVVLRVADWLLWTGPILAPMAVAWVGQVEFAMDILGWPLWAGIVFAAGFELTTAYVARLDWLSRHDGDNGLVFRLATWVFALIAAGMNYSHAAGPGLSPTGAAVAYGLMSLTGIALWELLSLYRHRKHLRQQGLRAAPLPRFGFNRWLNFPGVTWRARRLAILHDYSTVAQAWEHATQARKQGDTVTRSNRASRQLAREVVTPSNTPAPGDSGTRAEAPAAGGRSAHVKRHNTTRLAVERALRKAPQATQDEIAAITGLSRRTVQRHWPAVA